MGRFVDITGTQVLRGALALVVALAPALAGPDEDAYAKLVAAAQEHRKIDNAMRVRLAYLQALQRVPAGVEALVGLAEIAKDPVEREAIACELLRRHPADQALAKRLAALGPLPAIKTTGTATRLVACYLGRSERIAGERGGASVDTGAAFRPALACVAGYDAQGDCVPVDVVWTGTGGLEADVATGGLVATVPTEKAIATATDRKGGATVSVALRLVGPPAKIELRAKAQSVGAGDLLHLSPTITDSIGTRLWVLSLEWTGTGAGGVDLVGKTLRDAKSVVPADVPFEPHRNIVFGPKSVGDYTGPISVSVRVPGTAVTDGASFEVVRGATKNVDHPSAPLGWVESWEQALVRAGEQQRPILAFFEGDWCPYCRRLDGTTLADPRIVERAKAFVCVKVNSDRRPELVQRFKVKDLPTLVWLSRDGIELVRMPNDYTNAPDKVLAFSDRAIAAEPAVLSNVAALRTAAEAAPGSAAAWKALATSLETGGALEGAHGAYGKARDAARAAKAADADALAAESVRCALKLARWDLVFAEIDALVAVSPESAERPKIEYFRGLALAHGKRDLEAARAVWRGVIEKYPKDRHAAMAQKALDKRAEGR